MGGRFAAIIALALLGACSDLFGPRERIITLDVAPQTVSCVGPLNNPHECLRVRQHPDTTWMLFDDPIEGFVYEADFEYSLRVGVRKIANPPQDSSDRAYRLIAILRKTPASG